MPDKVMMTGWAVSWYRKRIAGNVTENTGLPDLIRDPGKVIEREYDETIDYGLFFEIFRNDLSARPFIRAELKVTGITGPIFFTNTFNEQYTDSSRAHVEVPFGPEETQKIGKLFWPSKNREFHKKGLHSLIVKVGWKKYGVMDQTEPEWSPKEYVIPLKITDVIPDH